jgi:hypothetical protein
VPYKSAPDVKRPSEELDDLLRGRVSWYDTSQGVQSWARLAFHDAACQVLAEPEIGRRRNMLGRVPPSVRPMVEAEVKRLWGLRRG